eukprot:scaffold3600_cov106-Skeletonema_marinoi.AAC.1
MVSTSLGQMTQETLPLYSIKGTPQCVHFVLALEAAVLVIVTKLAYQQELLLVLNLYNFAANFVGEPRPEKVAAKIVEWKEQTWPAEGKIIGKPSLKSQLDKYNHVGGHHGRGGDEDVDSK